MGKSEDMIVRHEGLRLKPYHDTVGKLTIGVGRNLDDLGISEEEALFMLRNDMEWVRAGLDKNCSWWRELDDVRRAVLENMAFNLGLPRFMGFKKMLAHTKAGTYRMAAREMLNSKWAKQVGRRAIELAAMMRYGNWPEEEVV